MSRLPTYFLSHGGGPWPYMPDWAPMMAELRASLEAIARAHAPGPKAVLVVSGHWEEHDFAISSGEHPGMVYDYGGFPPHTYQVRYPAPGSPALAARVQGLLTAAGLTARLDPHRGYDHGTFAPLAVMYPQADVPVVQLSLRADLDPATHVAAGRAIAALRDEGVLILGSGLSYHNLGQRGASAIEPSRRFDAWLQAAVVGSAPAERERRLVAWETAPAARTAHPREDHLIPLMVAVGAAADEPAEVVYHEDGFMGGWTVSSFRFGAA